MQQYSYPSTRSCIQETLKLEGVRGFYRGVFTLIATVPLRSSFNITLFSHLKHKQTTSNYFVKGFIPGFYTGSVLALLVCPVEMVKCYMQISSEFRTSSECFRVLNKRNGPLFFMRGLGITLARDSIGFGMFFGVYELIKGTIHDSSYKFTWWGWITCGSVSATACWLTILPLDCLKTRYQMSKNKESYRLVFKDIIENHGIRGFWVGGISTIARGCIASGVGFSVYELVKKHIPKIIPI